ncbi:hypothetical protein LEP1GSC193_4116 [Leptospira alstonii serovar Pingchang str. 80-412]|uniref:Uncharacterized protein n=2 Tax=Leptospira alstonii TaxID=28452 RepID=M6CNE3_9LEPT|nr:hypothetical protein LEP1GSC194_1770 [Leptospira alstonii serovar Sichuan str. 79601]EQA78340.1 hypothetical protein LEP1GSC193_4116 [Leptospira alstonii serovar Pingchang str. 80-412]
MNIRKLKRFVIFREDQETEAADEIKISGIFYEILFVLNHTFIIRKDSLWKMFFKEKFQCSILIYFPPETEFSKLEPKFVSIRVCTIGSEFGFVFVSG